MSTYTPPTINDGDAFDPETIKDGFDDFGTAINAAVDLNNIVASQLLVQQFHKNALTETWKASNKRLTASMPIRYDSSGDTNTLVVQTGRSFDLLNKFDVEDTSMCAPPPARFFSSAFAPQHTFLTHTIADSLLPFNRRLKFFFLSLIAMYGTYMLQYIQ